MIDYHHKYIKYKSKYQQIKQIVPLNRIPNGLQLGGCTTDKTQYAFYTDVANILIHIGKFNVNNKIIAGESWNLELDLPKGMYDAYKSNFDLIIVHESNPNQITKKYLSNKIFQIVGDVGVDAGTFGFYDTGEIYKLISKKNNLIGGPNMPFFDIGLDTTDQIVKSKQTNLPFGVQSRTDDGDGFFKCLIGKKYGIGILLAHNTLD
jgi:hypothetical protein